MVKSLKHFVLYKNNRYFSSFPSIVLLNDNRLLLMFRRARDSRWLLRDDDEASQAIKLQVDHIDARSQLNQIYFDLDLNPLSEAISLPGDPEAADQDACLLRLSNDDLLLSSFAWYPVHARTAKPLQEKGVWLYGNAEITGCFYVLWGGFTRLSNDNGKTWSDHQYLPVLPNTKDIIPGKRSVHGGSIRGQAIEIDNVIYLPTYSTMKGDNVSSSHLYVSKDMGQSWEYSGVIARDAKQMQPLNEASLLHLEGDTIMAFIRNTSGDDKLVTAISKDRGQFWAAWQERDIVGHPTHPIKLNDGRIFICYGYRHKPYGIRASLLDSKGETVLGDEIIIRDDGFCGDVGYPWAVQLPDNKVLVVYYFTQEDGIRHIAGSLIELDD